jgi:Ca2+-binding EF-hand superfamily protein
MKRLTWTMAALLACGGAAITADDKPREGGELFSRLDKNGDGLVSKDEVPEEQARFFERLARVGDQNDDGKLSLAEFGAAMRESGPRGEGRPQERPGAEGQRRPNGEMLARLKEFDANKDGIVTLDEVPEQARERFERMLEQTGQESINLERLAERIAAAGQREGDRPRPEGDRPRPEGDRPRPEGDRPRPEGDRPRPEGDRPRPEGDRPRPEGDRPRPEGEGGPRPGFRPAFLRVFDLNDDGRLNRDELRNAIERFEQLDQNKDGELDSRELMGPPPREGEGRPGFGPREGERPARDGERPAREGEGPRDGERPAREEDRPERDAT